MDMIKNHTQEQNDNKNDSNTSHQQLFWYLSYISECTFTTHEVPPYCSGKYKNSANNIEKREFAAIVTYVDKGIGNVTKA